MNSSAQCDPPSSSLPTSPSPTAASDATAVVPYAPSEWEREMYYHGISRDPPMLLYRSDFLENPFPTYEGPFTHVPTKSLRGVFGTPLNAIWETVGGQICDIINDHKILYVSVMATRFLIDGGNTPSRDTIWIATHPTTTAESAHDASQDILALLKANGIEGIPVEWYPGGVERL